MLNLNKFGLLPYQKAYLEDRSKIKIVEKSRQVGMTRTQALECVINTGVHGFYDSWMSSNNDLNAKEFIRYCKTFAGVFQMAVKDLTGHDFLKDVSAYTIEFASNGKRIHAVSSNPDQLHGKSGMIILDEFARRENEHDTWEAASPAALMWNYPMRIISTHNGKGSMFYDFLKKTENGQLRWSHHRITVEDAIAQGLADKVQGKRLTELQRKNYLENLKQTVANAGIWAQQFMCIPQDESEAFMPYPLLDKNAKAELLPFAELRGCKTLYGGLDVGRYKNLTVLWIAEAVSHTQMITRFVRIIQNEDFPKQEEIISEFLRLGNLRRICVDKTGMGIGLTDYLQKRYGQSRVEGVTLTAGVKESIAFRLRKYLQDMAFHIPANPTVLDDFHAVKQDTTVSGNIRLRADTNSDTGSHADYFWAACLCLEAFAKKPYVSHRVSILPKSGESFYKGLLKDFKKE